ncbi:flagellar biosynthesis protein FlhF [Idiomarina tyrosinivorans]|uniref:Flagellar biosynthesis protein FlhF n=1 Tax=Idiomarina tyrosinivorans TaxID=1445662 RepID=A0A432ZPI7_9GAMM|nr:flagellar biosynthesis protein FlhF [Idiomarina tyrosinivorans]RUO79807.1 flagellar biosynthesis protein FlhF [Idiomarina tyrosinivorans]
MKIKRFFAEDMRRALQQVKETLGADAVIMSNKRVNGGVEIVAAVDPDAKTAAPQQSEPQALQQPTAEAQASEQQPAQSLTELLSRQQPQGQAAAQPAAAADSEPQSPFPEQVSGLQKAAETAHAETTQSSDDIRSLQSQINGIRQLLEHQLSGLMAQEMDRREPLRGMLMSRMMKMGLSERVADQIACFIPEGEDDDAAWEQSLHLLQGQIATTEDDILTRGGIVALVGPTGVGKTTTIAKLAARYVQRHGMDKVALVTTDTFRIGASEQLQTYGRIIGCPVKVARDGRELADALLQLRDKSLVLIDTAGMGQRDQRLNQQLAKLMNSSRLAIRPYLVVAATAQTRVLNDTVKQFKQLPLAGCIFTKVDECLSLGESISAAIEHGLPISYLTDGQQVPEDIRPAEAGYLVAETERLYDKSICSNVSDVTKSYWNHSVS